MADAVNGTGTWVEKFYTAGEIEAGISLEHARYTAGGTH